MASVDHPGDGGDPGDSGSSSDSSDSGDSGDSHWVRWHRPYEDPDSYLSLRLRLVQSMVRAFLDSAPKPVPGSGSGSGSAEHAGPIRIVSLCAGQGRDVIDVVSTHPRRYDVSALLVELDPDLAAFARRRAAEGGVADQVRVVEGDASLCRLYQGMVPADLVLVCGVFGNISPGDITHTIQALPGFCRRGSEVIWTRHRRPPDATPGIRAQFVAAGFEEVAFEDPDGFILSVGRNRLGGSGSNAPVSFDPELRLFDFVGDGSLPA